MAAVAVQKKTPPAQREALIRRLIAEQAAEQNADLLARPVREQYAELRLARRRAGKLRDDIAQVQAHVEQIQHQRTLKIRRGAHSDEVEQLDDALLPASSHLDRLRGELVDVEARIEVLEPSEAALAAEKAEQAKAHGPARLRAAQERVAAADDAEAEARGRLEFAVKDHPFDVESAGHRFGVAVARRMLAEAYAAQVHDEVTGR